MTGQGGMEAARSMRRGGGRGVQAPVGRRTFLGFFVWRAGEGFPLRLRAMGAWVDRCCYSSSRCVQAAALGAHHWRPLPQSGDKIVVEVSINGKKKVQALA